jgi:sugar lactone lactonase YvrE
MGANQVVDIKNVDSNNKTISLLVYNWTGGGSFSGPVFAHVDTENANNLYISEYLNCRVDLFSSMQIYNPPPRIVAGSTLACGSTLNEINGAMGITLDKQKNLYVADIGNSRILRWAPNATSGVLIAGTNTSGDDSMSLNQPCGIFLDENNSLLYVVDYYNNRIQAFNLNGTPPYNGITVAGGNGQGSASNQFNVPNDVWVSKKTGAIYIADQANNRIQRWDKGATAGITLAGSPDGIAGSDSTHFNNPVALVINANETQMYVSDSSNARIQRFDLI